jgi:hypothetical protein
MTGARLKAPSPRGRLVIAGTITVMLLLFGACGGGDDEPDASDGEISVTTTEEEPTPTTQPPGSQPEAVQPIVEDLLVRKDEVTGRALRDPDQVLDEDAPIREELAEVFAPDEYDARLAVYEDNAASQTVFEPYNSDHMQATTLIGDVTTVDDDTVEAVVCTVYHYRVSSPSGGEVRDGVANPARVTVLRVDGEWLLGQTEENSSQVCDPEASA